MKILISGSRSINDLYTVTKAIANAPYNYSCIIHGGAKGVDSLAERVAQNSGIPTSIYLADWDAHGKKREFSVISQWLMNVTPYSQSGTVKAEALNTPSTTPQNKESPFIP